MRTAAYARYSSNAQREASIRDQLRNIAEYCTRHGWPTPIIYTDEAISGARADRPGYLQLITAAQAQAFDVLLVDDLSRLSRDHIESARALRLLKHHGIRVIGIADGIDTLRTGAKLEAGIRGLMSELYLDELAAKTHRGLAGQALAGYSAGGLPYGYRAAHDGNGHIRVINEEQAVIVREAFELYIGGQSPRSIAATFNARGIASPRGKTWSMSALYPDRRHVGLLGNPIYVGRMIWNRSQWSKDPITGRRRRSERPESDWITTDHPELAIIDAATWSAAEEHTQRIRDRTDANREHKPHARGAGRQRYLFSGLLVCGECGGPMTVVDRYRYGCGWAKDRGAAVCASRIKIPRATVEGVLLEGIKRDILSPEAISEFEREIRRLLRQNATGTGPYRKAVEQARREVDHIMTAIRAGILTPTTKAALLSAEQAARKAEADLRAAESVRPSELLPRARELYRGLVAKLETVEDVPTAREAIRGLFGDQIRVVRDASGIWAETKGCQMVMVAGAGFGYRLTPRRWLLHPARSGI